MTISRKFTFEAYDDGDLLRVFREVVRMETEVNESDGTYHLTLRTHGRATEIMEEIQQVMHRAGAVGGYGGLLGAGGGFWAGAALGAPLGPGALVTGVIGMLFGTKLASDSADTIEGPTLDKYGEFFYSGAGRWLKRESELYTATIAAPGEWGPEGVN